MTAKQVLCMKWGTTYGSDYVNKLYAMVRANTTGPLRFVCMTDDKTGIRAEVECLPCPEAKIEPYYKNAGWRKVSLFGLSDSLYGIDGDWLFIDLDVMVTGNMDGFFEHMPEQPFIVMRNWTQMDKKIGNTSVYRFRVGCAPYLLEKLESDFLGYLAKYNNSQTFISNEIKPDLLAFWPDAWCQLFKVQSVPSWPLRYFKAPIIPAGCKILAFPGMPNPPEAAQGIWPEKKWHKRLYKYIRPSPWIEAIWDESEKKAAAVSAK